MTRDSRDLDGVIDEVAQDMTSAELPRDLRPAIAARIASRPSWTLWWRLATAAAAVAVVVVAVVVVSRPGGEAPQQTQATAEPVTQPTVDVPAVVRPANAGPSPTPVRRVARVTRQTIAAVTPGIVEIDPVAIVPLKEDEVAARAPSQVVVIPPIDFEPVRISQLGSAE